MAAAKGANGDGSAMISVEGISKTFAKRQGSAQASAVRALQNTSLSVEAREFVALIGPSGCGKTTLLKLAGGLISPDPDGGRIVIDGSPVTGPGPDRAMVFQSFALLPWRDTLSNVELGLEARGVARAEREEVARAILRKVGLEGFERHRPGELSGGMQQRVGLARALAVQPQVLLMDEPFSALDEQMRRVLQEHLLRVWEEERQTVLFVTHSMEEAVYLADRIVIMSPRPGKVKEILEVPLPRPRMENEVRRSPEFGEMTSLIWERLREYVEAEAADGDRA